jgi:hypothetical protein
MKTIAVSIFWGRLAEHTSVSCKACQNGVKMTQISVCFYYNEIIDRRLRRFKEEFSFCAHFVGVIVLDKVCAKNSDPKMSIPEAFYIHQQHFLYCFTCLSEMRHPLNQKENCHAHAQSCDCFATNWEITIVDVAANTYTYSHQHPQKSPKKERLSISF